MENIIDEKVRELVKSKGRPVSFFKGRAKYEFKGKGLTVIRYEGPMKNTCNAVYSNGDFVYLSRSPDEENFDILRNFPGGWEETIIDDTLN